MISIASASVVTAVKAAGTNCRTRRKMLRESSVVDVLSLVSSAQATPSHINAMQGRIAVTFRNRHR